jgi:primary-amine oxidase
VNPNISFCLAIKNAYIFTCDLLCALLCKWHYYIYIYVQVGLSGILMVKATPYAHMKQARQNEDMHGTLLSENVIGVIHDHFVTFRLDMDVDGADNSFVRVEMTRQATAAGESPRRSYLKATRHVARAEKDAQVRLKLYDPAEFHVVNPTKKTRVGNPVGYKVVPGGTAASMLDPEDPPQKRGAFTNNQVRVDDRRTMLHHHMNQRK